MEVEVTINRGDLRAFIGRLMLPSLKLPGLTRPLPARKAFIFSMVMTVILPTAFFLAEDRLAAAGFSPSLLHLLRVLMWVTIGLGAFALLLVNVMLYGAPRLMASQPGVGGRKVFTITPDGLREQTDVNDTLIKWRAIALVEESDAHLFVTLDRLKMSGYVIPKRCFASTEQSREFADKMRAAMAAAKPLEPAVVSK